MIDVTDDVLNAYVDGALDAETKRAVEAHLARDAEARAYVDALRQVNALAPDAMDALLGDVPQSLIDAINSAPAATEATSKVVPLRPRIARDQDAVSWRSRMPLLAAALALAIVTAAGYALLAPRLGGEGGDLIASGPVGPASPLATLLEQGETGTAAAVATTSDTTLQATVMATFRDANGRYCRELEVGANGDAAGATSASIACRETDGAWRVEGSVAVAAAPAAGPDYVPSGSADDEPLAPLVRKLDLGKALSSEEERAALAARWKP